MYVINPLELEPYIPTVGQDFDKWGNKINNVLVNKIQPKVNEMIEFTLLNNDVYGGSASSIYLQSQLLSGGGA